MNYEKVQKYLKSMQTSRISDSELNGYQNYVNTIYQLQRKRSMAPRLAVEGHHQQHIPIYAPTSHSSGYYYKIPRYHYNLYQQYANVNDAENINKMTVKDAELSYTGEDGILANSFLELQSMEAKVV